MFICSNANLMTLQNVGEVPRQLAYDFLQKQNGYAMLEVQNGDETYHITKEMLENGMSYCNMNLDLSDHVFEDAAHIGNAYGRFLVRDNSDIIYEHLALYYSWTEEEKNTALCQELECEKRVLVQREEMVQVMNYAIKQRKKVSLISDMYIPEKILGKLLTELGITGYENLYVSCDYGKGKGSGLFDVYKNDVAATSYLHIGDNYEADCISAKKVKYIIMRF